MRKLACGSDSVTQEWRNSAVCEWRSGAQAGENGDDLCLKMSDFFRTQLQTDALGIISRVVDRYCTLSRSLATLRTA